MDQLKTRVDGDLLWITLSSVNNTIGSALLKELEYQLDVHAALPDPKVLVLSGDGKKFFSPGFDLHEVSRFDRITMTDFMSSFSRLSRKLFTYPKPTLAMLNGDALAGGFLLASCCAFRYAPYKARVGLTGLSRSVVIPFGNRKILESIIGQKLTQRITARGQNFFSQKAFQIGWLDGIVDEGDLETSVRSKAQELAGKATDVLNGATAEKRSKLIDQIRCEESKHLENFLDHWFSPEARLQIEKMLRELGNSSGE
jgi:enoyl-CoA hydratase